MALVGIVGLAARAQDPLVEPPKTPVEVWNAVEFELNTGKFDIAAQYLKAFLAANPTDQDYLTIERDRDLLRRGRSSDGDDMAFARGAGVARRAAVVGGEGEQLGRRLGPAEAGGERQHRKAGPGEVRKKLRAGHRRNHLFCCLPGL